MGVGGHSTNSSYFQAFLNRLYEDERLADWLCSTVLTELLYDIVDRLPPELLDTICDDILENGLQELRANK